MWKNISTLFNYVEKFKIWRVTFPEKRKTWKNSQKNIGFAISLEKQLRKIKICQVTFSREKKKLEKPTNKHWEGFMVRDNIFRASKNILSQCSFVDFSFFWKKNFSKFGKKIIFPEKRKKKMFGKKISLLFENADFFQKNPKIPGNGFIIINYL